MNLRRQTRTNRARTNTGAAAIAAVLVLAACSGHKTDDTLAPNRPDGHPVVPAGAGEGGSAVFEQAQSGRYNFIAGDKSYESTAAPDRATLLGALARLKGPGGEQITLGVSAQAVERARLMSGWTIEALDQNVIWHPVTCAQVPHVTVGNRWVVMLREKRLTDIDTAGSYDPAYDSSEGLIEIFDIESKQYLLAAAARASDSVFSLSLRAESDHSVSFLWADGPVQAQSIPYINRRTIDLAARTFTDETIDIGGSSRLSFATAAGGGYLVDIDRPKSQKQGVYAVLEAGANDPTLQLTMKLRENETPFGVAVSGTPGALKLTGAKTIGLPTDFDAARLVAVKGPVAYLFYRSKQTAAFSSEGVAVVDLSTGKLTQAFDHSGKAANVTGPPVANALWANGAERVVVLGVS